MRRNINTVIMSEDFSEVNGLDLQAVHDEDVIKIMCNAGMVVDNVITDNTGSRLPHRDAIQLIPRVGGQTNAQFFGATQLDGVISDNRISSNGSLQGVFASDGLFENLTIENNVIRTQSKHEITIGGMLSGSIVGNEAFVQLFPLRIGGSHPDSFYVSTFLGDTHYAKIEGLDTNTGGYDDRRFDGTGVKDFDIELFREVASVALYTGFNTTFKDVVETYKSFRRKRMTGKSVSRQKKLSQVVSSHEGRIRSFNRGKSGDAGSDLLPEGITVREVLRAGNKKYGSKGRIWAVGKYQFIPPTIKMAQIARVVSLDDSITDYETQDRLFVWAVSKKRKHVKNYITGNGSINRAMLDLSKEWASLPNPYTGRSYYNKNGVDKAFTSLHEVREALQLAKRLYSDGKSYYRSVV